MSFDYSRLMATCAVESPDKAITLPPEAYGSDDLYAAEVDRIFKRGWIPLCRVEQVPTPGSYYSIDILGTPLVVTHDRYSEIRCCRATARIAGWRCAAVLGRPTCCSARITCGRSASTGTSRARRK